MLQTVIIIILVELILVINYYFIIIVHEMGHILLGMLSSYRFLYCRIGRMAVVYTDKGFCIKKAWGFKSIGQCVLYPSEISNNPVYMIAGGIIFNFLFMIVFCIACLLENNFYLRIILGFTAMLQLISAIANLVSLESKIETDGKCLKDIKTNDEIKCYHMQLLITKYLINGYSYLNMPYNLFYLPDMTCEHSIIAYEMYLLLYYRHLEGSELKKAEEIISYLLMNKNNINKDFIKRVDREAKFLMMYVNAKMNIEHAIISKEGEAKESYFMSKEKITEMEELRYSMFYFSEEEYIDLLSDNFSEYIYPGEIKFMRNIYHSLIHQI